MKARSIHQSENGKWEIKPGVPIRLLTRAEYEGRYDLVQAETIEQTYYVEVPKPNPDATREQIRYTTINGVLESIVRIVGDQEHPVTRKHVIRVENESDRKMYAVPQDSEDPKKVHRMLRLFLLDEAGWGYWTRK